MTENSPHGISIRFATDADVEALVGFNRALAQETEGKDLDEARVASGVLRGIRLADEVRYVVAEEHGEVLGCLMLTREWSDWRDGWFLWLQSVYVLPGHRSRGVFRLMREFVVRFAESDPNVVGIRLYVHEENAHAQQVYLRSGFYDPSYRVLERKLH